MTLAFPAKIYHSAFSSRRIFTYLEQVRASSPPRMYLFQRLKEREYQPRAQGLLGFFVWFFGDSCELSSS